MTDEERAFTEWFAINYPGPHTVISDPLWHAPRIFRKAIEAERARSAKLFHLLQSIERRARTASMGSSFVDLMEVAEWAADALAEYEAGRD